MDKFQKIVDMLKKKHVVIDTGVLKDKHEEILNNLELGLFGEEAFSLVLLEKDVHRPAHIHDTSMAKFYFLEGKGVVTLNGNETRFRAGTYLEVPAGASHGFKIEEDTLMLSIQDNGGILKKDKSIDFRYE